MNFVACARRIAFPELDEKWYCVQSPGKPFSFYKPKVFENSEVNLQSKIKLLVFRNRAILILTHYLGTCDEYYETLETFFRALLKYCCAKYPNHFFFKFGLYKNNKFKADFYGNCWKSVKDKQVKCIVPNFNFYVQ